MLDNKQIIFIPQSQENLWKLLFLFKWGHVFLHTSLIITLSEIQYLWLFCSPVSICISATQIRCSSLEWYLETQPSAWKATKLFNVYIYHRLTFSTYFQAVGHWMEINLTCKSVIASIIKRVKISQLSKEPGSNLQTNWSVHKARRECPYPGDHWVST